MTQLTERDLVLVPLAVADGPLRAFIAAHPATDGAHVKSATEKCPQRT